MTSFLVELTPLVGWALLHVIWQAVLITSVTAIGLMLLRKARPQSRYLLCCIALSLCAALPIAFVTQQLLIPKNNDTTVSFASSSNAIEKMTSYETPTMNRLNGDKLGQVLIPTLEKNLRGQISLLVIIWACGVGLMAIRMALGLLWVRQRIHIGIGHSDAQWQTKLNAMAVRLGITRPVYLGVASDLESPFTTGWWHPIIIMPSALLSGMSPQLLEALLAHELAHIKRFDYLINLLQSAIEIFLFYHPCVWWLSKQIRLEREQIADDIAVELVGEPRRLALALSELEQFSFPITQFAQTVHAAQGGNLMSRITRLIRPDQSIKAATWKMFVPFIGILTACSMLYAHAESTLIFNSSSISSNSIMLTSKGNTTVSPFTEADQTSTNEHAEKMELEKGDVEHPFALVRQNDKGTFIHSNYEDIKEIDILKKENKNPFLWFRENGKSYLIRDQNIVEQALLAYQPMDALSERLEVHGKKMDEYGKVMDALGKQMGDISKNNQRDFDARQFEKKMEKHSKNQEALARKMETIASTMEENNNHEKRNVLRLRMEEIRNQMENVREKMDIEREKFSEQDEQFQHASKPMKELSEKMNEASKPMNELGKQMDVLGREMNVLSVEAKKKILDIIQTAKIKGLAISTHS